MVFCSRVSIPVQVFTAVSVQAMVSWIAILCSLESGC
jgi:hypothetical protein